MIYQPRSRTGRLFQYRNPEDPQESAWEARVGEGRKAAQRDPGSGRGRAGGRCEAFCYRSSITKCLCLLSTAEVIESTEDEPVSDP